MIGWSGEGCLSPSPAGGWRHPILFILKILMPNLISTFFHVIIVGDS